MDGFSVPSHAFPTPWGALQRPRARPQVTPRDQGAQLLAEKKRGRFRAAASV